MEALRPNRSVPFEQPYDWAFRGQADSRWALVPSALRPGTTLGFYADRLQYSSKGKGGCIDQMNGELIAVRQFAEIVDRVGLSVPGFHPFFRQDGFDRSVGNVGAIGGQLGVDDWPKPEMLELLAIAQHHGVPTRLLDFTFDPRIALFFAANDAVRNMRTQTLRTDGVEELAVWGANVRKLQSREREFGIVEVRRTLNPFLNAQKGLFVIDRMLSRHSGNETSLSLDRRVEMAFQAAESTPVMIKVTLPVAQAQPALCALALEGVDRPHLMPTLDNAVAYLRGQGHSSNNLRY